MSKPDFDLEEFTPFVLIRAAEQLKSTFTSGLEAEHNLTDVEWRVIVHLGQYGPLTARDITIRAGLHKTIVSRGVAALSRRDLILREAVPADRRKELLTLTSSGQGLYRDLTVSAAKFDAKHFANLSNHDREVVRQVLTDLGEDHKGSDDKISVAAQRLTETPETPVRRP